MKKWAGRYEIKEVAKRLKKTEDEILIDLESGKLSAIVRAEITSSDGSRSFDWSLIPAEGVRRMLAGTHNKFEWENYGIRRSCQSNPDQIRVLTRDANAATLHDALYWEVCLEDSSLLSHASSDINQHKDWGDHAREIADELFDHDTKLNTRDCLVRRKNNKIIGGYALRVMDKMQERNIHGPRGRIDNPATILREALQGDLWWKNKPK